MVLLSFKKPFINAIFTLTKKYTLLNMFRNKEYIKSLEKTKIKF